MKSSLQTKDYKTIQKHIQIKIKNTPPSPPHYTNSSLKINAADYKSHVLYKVKRQLCFLEPTKRK